MQRDNILIHSYQDIDSEKAMKQLKATRYKKEPLCYKQSERKGSAA
jgi:uncharacterized protein YutE (UPF0331/DUF86 family)